MTKNKWPKSDEKTGFWGTLGLEETQGDERRIVPRPPQPKVRGGALVTLHTIILFPIMAQLSPPPPRSQVLKLVQPKTRGWIRS